MSWSTVARRAFGPFLLAALFAGLMSPCVAARGHPPAGSDSSCALVAFVDEVDPAGLNVRQAPHVRAPVLGRLPPIWKDPVVGAQVRVRVEVTASKDGWFKIRNARDEEQLTEQPARPTYAGEGWVIGRKLMVKPQATAAHLRPDTQSPVGLQLGADQVLDSRAFRQAATLVACEGEWVQVDVAEARLPAELRQQIKIAPAARKDLPAGHFRVWVNQICGAQETACDGP